MDKDIKTSLECILIALFGILIWNIVASLMIVATIKNIP